jgi:hypothetical protein
MFLQEEGTKDGGSNNQENTGAKPGGRGFPGIGVSARKF